jgi:hypothetical protein
MDKIQRNEIQQVLIGAINDVKDALISDMLNKSGADRSAELNQLDTLKRLEIRINARIECYTKPGGTE